MEDRKHHTLSPTDWNEVRELFDRCQPLSQTQRLSLLARETRDRPWLREELESLLFDENQEEGPIGDPIRSALLNLARGNRPSVSPPPISPSAEEPVETFVPEQAGKYLLLERLGLGGMAEVFRAKLKGAGGFEKYLAVKRVLPAYGADPDFRTLFEFEAKLSSQLTHANIVQIHDFTGYSGSYLLAMEYVVGKNLKDVLARMKSEGFALPIDCSVLIISEVCKGLEYAHSRLDDKTGSPLHIIHRDISPKNIMVSYQGEVKIVDFGIAKARDRANLTGWGGVRGTLTYMSPEQVAGQSLDHRSDLFSIGAVLYELLAGTSLFSLEDGTLTTLQKIEECELPRKSIDALEVPEELKNVLRRALAKQPQDRYQTAGQFHFDLQQYLNLKSDPRVQKRLSGLMNEVFFHEIERERNSLQLESAPKKEPRKTGASQKVRLAIELPPPSSVSYEVSSSSRRNFSSLLFIVGLFIGGGVAYYFFTQASPSPIEREVAQAEIPSPVLSNSPVASASPTPEIDFWNGCSATIETNPPGAIVSMNGILIGKTPALAKMECEAPVKLRLEREGYEVFSRDIAVKKRSSRILLNLTPK